MVIDARHRGGPFHTALRYEIRSEPGGAAQPRRRDPARGKADPTGYRDGSRQCRPGRNPRTASASTSRPRSRLRSRPARRCATPSPDRLTKQAATLASDRRRRDWGDRSHVRTHAQSRADVECLARARSFYGPTRVDSHDSAAHGCARLIPDSFPRRLRLSPATGRNSVSVRRLRNPNFTPRTASRAEDTSHRDIGHNAHPPRFRPLSCGTTAGSVICSPDQTREARADERGRTVRPQCHRDFAVEGECRRSRACRVLDLRRCSCQPRDPQDRRLRNLLDEIVDRARGPQPPPKGESIAIDTSKAPFFKARKTLHESVN